MMQPRWHSQNWVLYISCCYIAAKSSSDGDDDLGGVRQSMAGEEGGILGHR